MKKKREKKSLFEGKSSTTNNFYTFTGNLNEVILRHISKQVFFGL